MGAARASIRDTGREHERSRVARRPAPAAPGGRPRAAPERLAGRVKHDGQVRRRRRQLQQVEQRAEQAVRGARVLAARGRQARAAEAEVRAVQQRQRVHQDQPGSGAD